MSVRLEANELDMLHELAKVIGASASDAMRLLIRESYKRKSAALKKAGLGKISTEVVAKPAAKKAAKKAGKKAPAKKAAKKAPAKKAAKKAGRRR